MSNEKDNGGPAFPVAGEIMIERSPGELYAQSSMGMGPQEGMTLRDYFAAKAMQGHWSNAHGDSTLDWMQANPELEDGQLRIVAKLAYAQADAMLKARNS